MTWTSGRAIFDLELPSGRPEICDPNGTPMEHDYTEAELRGWLEDGRFQLIQVHHYGARAVGEFVGIGAKRLMLGLRTVSEAIEPQRPSFWRRMRLGAG